MTHTHARTHGRNLLDEGSARRRDLNLTAHSIHKRQDIHAPSGNSNPQT